MHLTVNGYLVMLMLPCYQTDIKLLMLYICAYRNFDRRVYQFSSWFILGCPYFWFHTPHWFFRLVLTSSCTINGRNVVAIHLFGCYWISLFRNSPYFHDRQTRDTPDVSCNLLDVPQSTSYSIASMFVNRRPIFGKPKDRYLVIKDKHRNCNRWSIFGNQR